MGNKVVPGVVDIFGIINDRIYVGISEGLAQTIVDRMTENGLNRNHFGVGFAYRIKYYKRIQLKLLKEISETLEIRLKTIQRNITLITSHRTTHVGLRNPILPFDFRNKKGAIFVSSIFGDGGISKKGNVRYHNQDKRLINIFINSISFMGDVDYKLYKRPDKTIHVSLPIVFGHILKTIGISWGYKTTSDPKIPDFILNSNAILKSYFIRQFFNDEGNVRLKDRRLQVKQTRELKTPVSKETLIENPDKHLPSCLRDIKKMLLDLNITSKINLGALRSENKKADWELSVYGKENLERFRRKIGFDSQKKLKGLDKCIETYKFPSSGRNERFLFALQHIAKIQSERGFVNKHILKRQSKRALKTSTYFLVDLKKNGMIKELERIRDKKGRLLPVRYVITKKGLSHLRERKDRIFIRSVRESI